MQLPPSGPEVASGPGSPPARAVPGAYFALVVLFSMNLLNYIDRYVFAAVGPSIQAELHLRDRRFGYLASAFMIVYTIASPVIGWLGDRSSRRRLIAFGVGLWSVATVGTAFARDYQHMFFWRALLGVGEASYGVVAPTLLADLFPPRLRGRVMGIYSLALPTGGALGYGLGGWIDAHWGWRAAFWVVGVPGLIAAGAGLAIRDPGRGASEGVGPAGAGDRPRPRDYLELVRTRSFLYNIGGMAAVTFATGAFAVWGPTFYHRVRRMELKQANLWIGGLTAVAGLLGIALGTWLADWLLRFTRRAYLIWAALAVGLAIPFGLFGILDHDRRTSLGLMFLAMVLMASVLGPCNTVTADVVPPNRRAAGYALNIFLIHLFGDISSPILIGYLSDLFGKPSVAGSTLGQIL
ncbi:MAG TPA: MFS transporter, partial [Isosphaeraceae bacterium]